MRSFVILIGQPLSSKARLITACKTASGVDIIPPQRVTRANCKLPDHLQKTKISKSNSVFHTLVFHHFQHVQKPVISMDY